MGAGGGINIPVSIVNTGQSPQQLAQDVNVAIGAFERMGRTVSTTSAQAVAAYRLQGEALYLNLLTLGRTEQELNQVSAAIRRTEQAYGAHTIAINENTSAGSTNSTGARRGASAVATLAFAMESGRGSARGMAIAVGSATQSIASLGSGAGYAALGGLAATVTILAVIVGLLYETSAEAKRANDTLGDLGKLNTNQLRQLAATEQANFDAQVKRTADAQQRLTDVRTHPFTTTVGDLVTATRDALIERKHLDERLKEHDDFRKRYVESEAALGRDVTEEIQKANEKAAEAITDNTKGPFAARRKAADNELADQIRSLRLRGIVGDDFNKLEAAAQTEHAQKIIAIDRDENNARVDLAQKFSAQLVAAKAKLNKDVFDNARAAADERYQQDLIDIDRDRRLVKGSAEYLDAQRKAFDVRRAAITQIENERSDKILEIREELQGKLDELADRDADPSKIHERIKKQVDIAQQAIDSAVKTGVDTTGPRQIIALAPQVEAAEIAKARIDKTLKDDNLIFENEQQNITRIQALKEAGRISDEEARQRTLVALKEQYDGAVATLTRLQELAAELPGNAQAQADVEQYTTKVLQLGIAISQLSDRFHDLKQAGLAASQSAIASLAQALPQVLVPSLGQSQAVYEIDQMKAHVASANAELQQLLQSPRTPQTIAQISQLRAEIQNTNIEIKNAQRSLTTWKTLFLDATRSIVSALAEVSSKMLATLLIQDLLHGFGGGGGSGASFVGDVVGAGVFAASGGMIRGPGTGTSDSIPARLSTGEYVVNARATARVGQSFLDSINALGQMPMASRPSRIPHYAGGGLVSASSNDAGTSLHATIGLEQGLVLAHLESREGEAVVLKVLSKNQNKLRAMLGSK